MKLLSSVIGYFATQGFARALRHRDYLLYSLTSWFSTIGAWMHRLAIGWLTWDLTHSGVWLGVMVAASSVPSAAMLPFTGAMTDRMDRLVLLRITQAILCLLNTLLAGLVLADAITIEILFAITVIFGIVVGFNMPARMTIAPSLVPREDLPAAISVNSFLFTTAIFMGPAIAGLMIEYTGSAGLAMAANAVTYIPFYIALFVINLPDRAPVAQESQSLIADVVDGVRYIAAHPGIGPLLTSTVLLSVLVRPLSDMMPGFIDDVFRAGPAELGLILSAYGVGGMIGSFWMGNRGRFQGTTRIYIVHGLILTSLTVVFASLNVVLPAIVLMAILGISNSITNNASQSLIQGSVAPTHRVRVISLFGLNSRAGPALGALIMGYLSHFFGLQIPVGVAAAIGFGVMLVVALRWRAIAEATESRR